MIFILYAETGDEQYKPKALKKQRYRTVKK